MTPEQARIEAEKILPIGQKYLRLDAREELAQALLNGTLITKAEFEERTKGLVKKMSEERIKELLKGIYDLRNLTGIERGQIAEAIYQEQFKEER
jgi:hypothetical protein